MRQILLALPVLAAGLGALALGLPSSSGPDWSEADLALVRSLALEALPPVPADPSNRVAGDPRAVNLGRAIFFDPRFSATGEVACASCHLPDRQFQGDRALARGVGRTDRRTIPIAGPSSVAQIG